METTALLALYFVISSPKLNMIPKEWFFLSCLRNWLILNQSLFPGAGGVLVVGGSLLVNLGQRSIVLE